MDQLSITRTKDYLVLKIPLKMAPLKKKVVLSPTEGVAIRGGLKALGEGRISKSFKNAREAVRFLRSL